MTLDTLIIFGGAFVAVLPFLGFPNSWDRVLLFLAGISIIALGIVVRRRLGPDTSAEGNDTFVENAALARGGHEEV